jgi:hypothetical protein
MQGNAGDDAIPITPYGQINTHLKSKHWQDHPDAVCHADGFQPVRD